MIDVEDWAEIRRLHRAEGMRDQGDRPHGWAWPATRCGRRCVRTSAPRYRAQAPGSAVDAFEPAIRRLLAVTPDMPATVIAERIGWAGGITVLQERVAELRPLFVVPEAVQRTEYKPGELAQWDLWFPDDAIPRRPRPGGGAAGDGGGVGLLAVDRWPA